MGDSRYWIQRELEETKQELASTKQAIELLIQGVKNPNKLNQFFANLQIDRGHRPVTLHLPNSLQEARFKPRQSSRIQYMSVYQTLNTTELLEQILIRVPAYDIVRCRLVSKRFKDTIDTSRLIKKALFLVADPDQPLHAPAINPFFKKRLSSDDPPLRRLRFALNSSKLEFECTIKYSDDAIAGRSLASNERQKQPRVRVSVFWFETLDSNPRVRPIPTEDQRRWVDMVLIQPPGTVAVSFEGRIREVQASTLIEAVDKVFDLLLAEFAHRAR